MWFKDKPVWKTEYFEEGLKYSVADPGFSPGGAPTPKSAIIFQFFAENCMKMKEFGPPGGARPWRPPLDPPMILIPSRFCTYHLLALVNLFKQNLANTVI